ncbi:ABC transporter substrate-binding protein [Actinokineospora sp. NBRC 105648]|uniref:ABC transporter substrate-binding protein n=1 Tax=Actinokineospora sp. NBRC 105648 TaxID=3032206 RepID=UPI0024A10D81|nr:ABC transporter substrate-binding protein [Actinokineospora sp. NBRC 105648]GLZ40753.1 hypothetical protein Acsp05_43770 [Actinokineospora sp. NBRC 105648]
MTRFAKLLVLTAVTAAVAAVSPWPALAVDHTKGQPGFCATGTGVTVVVDFQQLGGTTIVRCFPQGTRGTGLDALKGAGFQVAGVARWGESFICRVENRPSAVEELPIKGREHYRESCVDTPPGAGYWSYWHAGNNCPWTYSQWGVKNRDFTQGGFEGWSFSLNATADSNPVPRIAPVRPGTSGQPCVAVVEPPPDSDDPNAKQPSPPVPAAPVPDGRGAAPVPTSTAGAPVPVPTGASAPTSAAALTSDPAGRVLPPPVPRSGSAAPQTADPAQNVAYTGGENAADVNQVVKEQSGASDYAPWVAGAAVVLLAAATWLTARRRRRARDA